MANLMIDMLNEVDHKIDLEHGAKSVLDDLNESDDGEDDDGGDPNASKSTQPDANTETISRINRFPEDGNEVKRKIISSNSDDDGKPTTETVSKVAAATHGKDTSEHEPKRKKITSNDDGDDDDGGEPTTYHPPSTQHARITANIKKRKQLIESESDEEDK